MPIERQPDAASLALDINHRGVVGRHRTPYASLLGDSDAVVYGQEELHAPDNACWFQAHFPMGTTSGRSCMY